MKFPMPSIKKVKQEEKPAGDEESGDLEGVEFKKGDYQIQVRIYEGRDLAGRDASGMSDPVVVVECMGKKELTDKKKQTKNPLWDRVLFFQFSNLEPEDIETGTIDISVMDANSILSDTLIGSYEIDIPSVYVKKNHKLKGWAGLMDTTSEKNKGIQGYLKFSITVLGPGDEAVVEEEEDSVGDMDKSGVLMPPRLEQESWIVCVQVFEARDLPRMDRLGDQGIDAFVALKLGGKGTINSSMVKNRNPIWNQELHVPFTMPGMARKLEIALMDYDVASANELISTYRLDVSKLKEQKDEKSFDPPEGCVPFWVNFYGPQKTGSLTKNNSYERMAKGLMEGVSYDGCVLMQVWKKKVHESKIEYINLPRGSDKQNSVRKTEAKKKKRHAIDLYSYDCPKDAHVYEKRKTARLPTVAYPDTSDYRLMFTVFEAVELPFADKEISFEVTFGKLVVATSSRKISNGSVVWDPIKETNSLDGTFPNFKSDNPAYDRLTADELRQEIRKQAPGRFPEDRLGKMNDIQLRFELNQLFVGTSMLPDVIVYLKRGDARVAYSRLAARKVLGPDLYKPSWILLKEDLCLNAVAAGEMPGTLLLRMKLYRRSGFYSEASTLESPAEFNKRVTQDWERILDTYSDPERVEYELRCHLYQASELPSADSNGSLDPFIVVQCAGVKAISKVKYKTTSPHWYQTLVLSKVMLPKEISLCPDISVTVFDEDKFTKNEPVGRFLVRTRDFFEKVKVKTSSGESVSRWESKYKDDLMEPYWEDKLFLENPEEFDAGGRVLVSWQLIPASEVAKLPTEHIWPELTDVTIELTVVGLRGLLPSPFPVNSAMIEFDTGNVKHMVRTKESKNPSGSDPNHLEVYKLKIMLPVEVKFTPDLNIRVFDVRGHGFIKFMIASGSLALGPYLPWNSEAYLETLTRAGVDPSLRSFSEIDDEVPEEIRDLESVPDSPALSVSSAPPTPAPAVASSSGAGPSPSPAAATGPNQDLELAKTSATRSKVGSVAPVPAVVAPMAALPSKKAKKSYGPLDDESEEEADVENSGAEAEIVRGVNTKQLEDWRAKWLLDRVIMDDELEDQLSTTPFHDIQLVTGAGEKRRPAGMFQGYVRVIPEVLPGDPDDKPYLPSRLPFKLTELMKPRPFLCRVYILRAFGLMPKDRGGTSDPYIVIRAGRAKPLNNRDQHKNEVVSECYFYKCFELPVTLPGPQLDVSIYDWNRIGADELIGTTKVDLCNRWFNNEWRGKFTNKPIERRSLYHPSVGNPQGKLEMWVDIIPNSDTKKFPAFNIAPPPPEQFELRIVLWKTRKVPSMDPITGLNDMFIRVELEGGGKGEVKETDTHWRSKKGRANFNYRMVFPVIFDVAAPKNLRLKVSAWDRDIISSNDAIGEVVLGIKDFVTSSCLKWRAGDFKPITASDDPGVTTGKPEKEDVNRFYLWGDHFSIKDRVHSVPNKWLSLGEGKGELLLTVELIHKNDAQAVQVGEGRESPNQHPFLQEPARPKFDLMNPLGTLATLVGPDIWNRFKCLIICLCCCVCFAMAFMGLSYVRIWFT